MEKTLAQELIEEGEAIGEKRGREIGKELGIVMAKQDALIRLLKGKFRSIPQEYIERIKSIQQIEQLDDLFDRAIFAENIKDLGIE